jgi:outer membrane protein assembly factor BamB
MKARLHTPPLWHRAARLSRGLLLLATCGAAAAAGAADWPQWRGPQRNGISAEKGWLSRWPATGPRRAWTAQVGAGYSAVAVSKGRVYTMGNANGQDTVFCLDAGSGRVLWRYSYPQQAGDYGGPRATPAVDGTVDYTLSREGIACSINATSGKANWKKDLRRETGAQTPQWGFAGSPLVYAGKIIYNVGERGTALDGFGKIAWKSGSGISGYASPVPYQIGAQKGVAIFTASSVAGVNPHHGGVLWEHPWQTQYNVNGADPQFVGDTFFVSSNYGRGCARVRVSSRPQVLWENRNMKNHFNSSVVLGGYVYGNDENTLKCLDLATGAEKWRQRGGLGKGGLIAADGKLIVLTERGELTLVAADPNAYRELARARVMPGTCWTHPVLSGSKIYCRNQSGELICLDVKSSA